MFLKEASNGPQGSIYWMAIFLIPNTFTKQIHFIKKRHFTKNTIVFIILYIYIIIIYNIYQYSSYIGKYLLNQKCSKNIIIVKDYDNLKLLQYSVSHDPSEIILIFWFWCSRNIVIINTVENGCTVTENNRNIKRIAFIWNILFRFFFFSHFWSINAS